MTKAPRWVSSLLGHRHVEMAILCLGSLLRGSADLLALRLHDDGSLTADDRGRLAAALGDPVVVTRREADEEVAGLLAHHPALADFRRSNPLALKLIDAVLYAGEELAYCDTDVLFLRPFAGLFSPGAGAESEAATATFMADHQNAYSVRSWHLLRSLVHDRRLRLARRVNSGVIQFPTAAWDPDLLEWYLGRPEFGFAPVWAEQTAWALLGAAAGCRLFDPRQIAIPTSSDELLDERVALHFVSPVRALLPLWEGRAVRAGDGRPPVAIERVPAGRCGPLDLAADEVRRRLARLR